MMGTSFEEAMDAVEPMVKLRCKLDADLRQTWRPENEQDLAYVMYGPKPDVTAEHAIYLVLRGVALLERDGVPASRILRQIDTKLRLDVLPLRARKMPTVEDYLVAVLRKVAPAYLDHGPKLLAAAIAVARKKLRKLPEDGVWTTPDGRPPETWRFWRIPKADESRRFWPLRTGVPIVPETRHDIELADILIRKQPGDELWEYRSPSCTWRMMMGMGGIALVREGRVLCDVTTRMN
jgi:hypothetical protein